MSFIQEQGSVFGVEPICKVLPIAPSTAYKRLSVLRDPSLASNRAQQDAKDWAQIERVYEESGKRYGSRKVWHQLAQEQAEISKCRVERLMKTQGIQGVVRGKRGGRRISDQLLKWIEP